jgi:alkyl hydroperoxide reductase subunit AhpC
MLWHTLMDVEYTELGAFAKLEPEFTRRNTKLIGLSANTIGTLSAVSKSP